MTQVSFKIKVGQPVQIKQGKKVLTEMSKQDVETLIATLCRYYFDTTGKENIVLETNGEMTGLITDLKNKEELKRIDGKEGL
jgi:hypothetical protein